jgi:SAM-dependent methyltransferase
VTGSAKSADVAGYYDSNTPRFLLVGRGRAAHAMHRELWGPGVGSAFDAADHINHVVGDEIAALDSAARAGADPTYSAPTILDFGCGVGGTLFHLAGRFPEARLAGITVSPRQAAIAEGLAGELGLTNRCSIPLGDFQVTDLGLSADVIVAVESFAHSDGADGFLASATRHLRPGGHLILADDFLAREEETLHRDQRRCVLEFRTGWRVPAVCTVEHFVQAATARGLRPLRSVDLTSLTRPGSRVRDRLVGALRPLFARLGLARRPFFGNIIGGGALQVGLREGFIRYQLLVLRRDG